jgi:hypothetical protein
LSAGTPALAATPIGEAPDSRTRFLREIGTRLPAERVMEVHLFPAIRQGGVESGVAVVAVAPVLEREVVPNGQPSEEPPLPPVDVRAEKHTVYTATYRLVLKGTERGKWESAVNAEAEAPLQMVGTVVQGVQRRLGDEGEPERISGAEFHDALRAALLATGAGAGQPA